MSSKQLHFYATKDDMQSILTLVESQCDLCYLPYGQFDTLPAVQYSLRDAQDLGTARAGDRNHNTMYVVALAEHPIKPRTIRRNTGRNVLAIDQLINEETLTLNPGGLYGDGCLIQGDLGTCHYDNEESRLLFELFRKTMQKHFKKVGSIYVGKQAFEFLKKGKRLTFSIYATPEYDLRLPPQGSHNESNLSK